MFKRHLKAVPSGGLENHQDGQVIEEVIQEKLRNKRSQNELTRATVMANWMVGIALVAMIVAIFNGVGWFKAEERYANNVQVTWVKLLPDGTHRIEAFGDGGADARWHEAAINSSLMNYVQARFQQHHDTIRQDYGFASQFLSPKEEGIFMSEFKAVEKVVAFEECLNCAEVDLHIRLIDHEELNQISAQTDIDRVFRSTIYTTEIVRSPSGKAVEETNKLVHLTWKLSPPSSVIENRDMLLANPLGIQITNQIVREELSHD
ncbi:VirB8/TrbF family protein [Pelagibius sp. Alg239-R121]|uniref:VirB8/TrbF family protein n=1 Tax=Pelagibius sp. Alg239-R121 TaxID=2993448 RepID=UPI0024A796F1|nr:VirB8/TrbF family protein [Pelagibius sp. Alg239-R121]